jgi:hypothetical protein
LAEHDDAVQYWVQRYTDTVAEHNKELVQYRKFLANKYAPLFASVLNELAIARGEATKAGEGAPPNENSNWVPPFPEN